MKRTRAYAELLEDRDRAWTAFCALRDECAAHPEAVAAAVRWRRDRLALKLPPCLRDIWVRTSALYDVEVDCSLGEDARGDAAWCWTCSLYTGDDRNATTHTIWSQVGTARANDWYNANFEYVDFDADWERMWRAALERNDGSDTGAMAAVCFACCEHLDNVEALPLHVTLPVMMIAAKEGVNLEQK